MRTDFIMLAKRNKKSLTFLSLSSCNDLRLVRDSTVQTLTLQPSVQGGRVTYLDSPLVCMYISVLYSAGSFIE